MTAAKTFLCALSAGAILWAGCGDRHAFQLAVQQGQLDRVSKLLASNPALINTTDKFGASPLHMAAVRDDPEVTRVLLEKGASVHARTKDGCTPLLTAAWRGRPQVVKVLLANGADVDAAGHDSNTALHLAAAEGHAEVVRLLLEHGAEVNLRNHEGATPLHLAAEGCHRAIGFLLIGKAADVNAKDNAGATAMHRISASTCESAAKTLAVGEGQDYVTLINYRIGLMRLLMQHGADLDARDAGGRTPLGLALLNSQKYVADVLRSYGCTE